MKNIFSICLALFCCLFVQELLAQAPPQRMTYQFVARNAQNQLIQNNAVGLRISILQGSPTGNAVYVETHTPQTNGNGTATIEVGGGTVVSGVFANIDWSTGVYFIRTETDPNGGSNYTLTTTSQLLSLPYAFYAGRAAVADSVANNSGQGWNLNGNNSTNSSNNFIGTTDAQDIVLKTNNTERIRISSNGNLGIGTNSPNSAAITEMQSISQGFLPPRMTHSQRNSISNPTNGLFIFNLTTGCPNYYFNGNWYDWCATGVSPLGAIASLNCGTAINNGTLTSGSAASGVSSTISYTGGNGAAHSGQAVSSTGVTGLTATLLAGNFNNGTSTITYTITGTPATSGTANFALNIGGQTCNLLLTVSASTQYPVGSVFCASGPTIVNDVINPATGKTWMDRNLGASRVALSSTDSLAYGDLYQWGRRSDGHQCRNSATTSTLSSTDQPANGNFILAPNSPIDWRSPQNSNLWQGVNGVNNPCPSGYRLPTDIEMDNERISWSSQNSSGAFASVLKFSLGGGRSENDGSLWFTNRGIYWSGTVVGGLSRYISFSTNAYLDTGNRASGASVRCIKN